LGSSIAASTRHTYTTGQTSFLNYCRATGIASPWNPSQPVLVGYVCWLHRERSDKPEGLAHSTMKTYLMGVRHAHVAAGLADPTKGKPALETALRAVKLKLGSKKKERLPVTVSLLNYMREFIDFGSHDQRVVWAVLCLGVYGLLRLGELLPHAGAGKQVRDNDYESMSPVLVEFKLKQSKTDPFREGCRIRYFKDRTPTCPVAALADLIKNRPKGLGGRSQLTPTFTMSHGKVLRREEFTLFLRALASKVEAKYGIAGNAEHYSGHSLRKGGATSLALRGISADVIRILGRWKSLCYRLYLQMSMSAMQRALLTMATVTDEDRRADLGIGQKCSAGMPRMLWYNDVLMG
jgi:hypothetical protein